MRFFPFCIILAPLIFIACSKPTDIDKILISSRTCSGSAIWTTASSSEQNLIVSLLDSRKTFYLSFAIDSLAEPRISMKIFRHPHSGAMDSETVDLGGMVAVYPNHGYYTVSPQLADSLCREMGRNHKAAVDSIFKVGSQLF
jgi:hypothetical protein